ncbi:MAG: menaquinol-cytochrome c reductase iron-sulfur subunit [Gaiellales bacterium]|nr:menaquinol-cytochrome c reductase iron-sulfur subunit [Gaiellales bacterium]
MAETPADNQQHRTTPGEAAAAAVHPGSPQSAMTRQAMFATGATVGLGALMSAIIAVPVTVAVLAPSFKTIKEYNVDIGPTSLYPKAGGGQIPWHAVTFENKPDDTTGLSRRLVYVRNDGNDKFTAIANTCMHLGCPVQANATGFACPCHGGQYDSEGRRIAGPPVRPLNRYETTVDTKGHLILGKLYAMDDSLHRHQLKGPGQPVKGILSYLYPAAPQG